MILAHELCQSVQELKHLTGSYINQLRLHDQRNMNFQIQQYNMWMSSHGPYDGDPKSMGGWNNFVCVCVPCRYQTLLFPAINK